MNREQYFKKLQQVKRDGMEIIKRKNADYATSDDPFANFRQCESLGVCSVERGMLVRMGDKMSRIANLLSKRASVKDESIVDTLRDLANYADIMSVYLEGKAGLPSSDEIASTAKKVYGNVKDESGDLENMLG